MESVQEMLVAIITDFITIDIIMIVVTLQGGVEARHEGWGPGWGGRGNTLSSPHCWWACLRVPWLRSQPQHLPFFPVTDSPVSSDSSWNKWSWPSRWPSLCRYKTNSPCVQHQELVFVPEKRSGGATTHFLFSCRWRRPLHLLPLSINDK